MQGTLSAGITYKDFPSPSFSNSTGQIGGYLTTASVDVSVEGKTPIGAMFKQMAHAGSYIAALALNGNTLSFIFWRAASRSETYAQGDCIARVLYK